MPLTPETLPEYLATCQRVLHLVDWIIVFDASGPPQDEESIACVGFEEHGRAHLRFAAEFWLAHPDKQRAIVCHELGHIMLRRAAEAVEAFEGEIPSKAWRIWSRCWEAAEEAHVEHLARLLAPTLPLP